MTAPYPPKPRSKRICVYWGVALALLLVLGLVCWVIVPFFKTRAAVSGFAAATAEKLPGQYDAEMDAAVEELGGRISASRRLKSYMQYPDWAAWHKDDAAFLLSRCGDSGIDALVDILDSRAGRTEREAAALALVWMRPPPSRAVPALTAALDDPSPSVRQQAARALRRQGPQAATAGPALIRTLEDADSSVRRASAQALGAIGPAAADAHAPLTKRLEDDDAYVRKSAGRAIWKISGDHTKYVKVLNDLLAPGSGIDREVVCRDIEKLGPEAKGTVPALVKALTDNELMVRIAACKALGAIGAGAADAIPALEKQAQHRVKEVRQATAEALKKIRAAEKKPGGSVRTYVVKLEKGRIVFRGLDHPSITADRDTDKYAISAKIGKFNRSQFRRCYTEANKALAELGKLIREADVDALLNSFRPGHDGDIDYYVSRDGNALIKKELLRRGEKVRAALLRHQNDRRDIFTGASGPDDSVGWTCKDLLRALKRKAPEAPK